MTPPPRHSASRAMLLAAAAGTLCVFSAGPVMAAQVEAPSSASHDTSAMIMGPLRQELDAPRPTAPSAVDLARGGNSYGLSYSADAPRFEPNIDTLTASAANLAGSALTARTSDAVARHGLSAFSGRSAVLARTPAGAELSVSMSDALAPGAAPLAFDPVYAETSGRALNPAMALRHRNMAVNYEAFFDAPGGQAGLDVGVSPRAGFSMGDDGPAARAGATVRLGQYLGALENDRPAWWFFAGADRQAVLYDPGQGFDVRDAIAMRPYAMVGDAQAGVAVRVGSADVSLAYVHRETEYSMPTHSWDTSEGFAAFSLTWKR